MLSDISRALLGLATLTQAATSAGAAAISPRAVHERRSAIPYGWSLKRRADPDLLIPLSFALSQPHVEHLETYLLDIADPASPNYGKHWSPSRVAETFRPTPETVETVTAWLNEAGVDPTRIRPSKDGGYLDLKVTIAEAEAMLATEYYVYEHKDGTEHVACEDRYHLPEHVAKHVDTVWPTVHFDVVPLSHRSNPLVPGRTSSRITPSSGELGKRAAAEVPTNCDSATTLDCLRALYNFNYTLQVPDEHSIGIVEFGSETLNLDDLDLFFENYSPSQIGQRPAFVGIDGGISNQSITDPDLITESNLDFQYAMGLLGEQAQVLQYQVTTMDGPSFDYLPFDLLLNALDGDYCTFEGGNPPQLSQFNPDNEDCGDVSRSNVVSISYYQTEVTFGPRFAQRQCTEYGKLSMMGMTFLICSGDYGVATFGDSCADDDGQFAPGNPDFAPSIGSTCPYVTSVGATQVKRGFSVTDPNAEKAANVPDSNFKSGGGFSGYFARPSFQDDVVQSYIDSFTGNLSANAFNRSGRAYPDVSANGHNFQVVVNQDIVDVDGTSASTPTWAAFITAVNDARIAAGKGSVGWANPALYSDAFADVFHDITEGDNFACGEDQELGFVAAPGWDPVTGLGTPDFEKLLDAWMALP